jgi:hypothetical protein
MRVKFELMILKIPQLAVHPFGFKNRANFFASWDIGTTKEYALVLFVDS